MELLKVEADARNMSPDEVRTVTQERLVTELGMTPEDLAVIGTKGPQIIERVENHRKSVIKRNMMQSVRDAMTAEQIAWIKADGNFESLVHFIGRSTPPEE